MKKLLKLHDAYTLKILICLLLIVTALYPKLPSIHIMRTWVYIRLEDFLILATVLIWFIQLIRKKVTIPVWIGGAIGTFWLVGLVSVLFSVAFIGPHLLHFFPHLAFLAYFRRIEYMILFFVAFSTVKSVKDIRDYLIILSLTVIGVLLYGLGQKYYLFLWEMYPKFFEKYSFCFPSFQTGNEEFAKGLPLCLPKEARVTSTFGGHYDLAGYLVIVLPVFLAIFLSVKRWIWKFATAFLFLGSLVLLILTASRVSFGAYIVGSIATLMIYRKKWYIIPVVALSIILLLGFSESTAKRFLSTIRISSIVTNSEGQLIGEATTELPKELEKKISKNPVVVEQPPVQSLPQGSAFIGLPTQKKQTPTATSTAVVKKTLSSEEARRLQLANGTLQLSTVSGNFTVKQALVYDISFTTRFQSEWPNAWAAFLRNPLIGSGYSTITLATDNDYLRALGEVGLLGFFSFALIFIVMGITLKELAPQIKSPLVRGLAFGLAGGVVGLACNAVLIDVFEASKIAENLWILLGIGVGGLFLYKHHAIPYWQRLKSVLTSGFMIGLYLFVILCSAFLPSLSNFFVADDFTWLHWAATATLPDVGGYFIEAQNFFYRPLSKSLVVLLYSFLSFQPGGYHMFTLVLHFLAVIAVYLLATKLLKNKFLGFLTAIIFLLHPSHSENIYWFSTISVTLGTVFILYAVYSFIQFREQKSTKAIFSYLGAFLLSIFAFISYEIAVILPILFIAVDLLIAKPKRSWKIVWQHLAFVALVPLYFVVRHLSHAFSGGGDYSYSITNFIPNLLGNIFGYVGLFLAGHNFLPFYNALRENFSDKLPVFILITVLIVTIVVIVVITFKKQFYAYSKRPLGKSVTFGFVFALIALVPFLPMGNIAERYLYLASFGLALAFIALLQSLMTTITAPQSRQNIISMLIIVTIIGGLYHLENSQENKKWQKAGEITKNTLSLFRTDYPNLKGYSNIYFVDTPIKYNGAWVFPVGLKHGLWFIYGQDLPVVYQAKTVEEARAAITANGVPDSYIFIYDKEGKLTLTQ